MRSFHLITPFIPSPCLKLRTFINLSFVHFCTCRAELCCVEIRCDCFLYCMAIPVTPLFITTCWLCVTLSLCLAMCDTAPLPGYAWHCPFGIHWNSTNLKYNRVNLSPCNPSCSFHSGKSRTVGVDVYNKKASEENLWNSHINFTRQSYSGDKGVPSYVMRTQVSYHTPRG